MMNSGMDLRPWVDDWGNKGGKARTDINGNIICPGDKIMAYGVVSIGSYGDFRSMTPGENVPHEIVTVAEVRGYKTAFYGNFGMTKLVSTNSVEIVEKNTHPDWIKFCRCGKCKAASDD